MHQQLLRTLLATEHVGERHFIGGAALFRFHRQVQILCTPFFIPCLMLVLAGEKRIVLDGVAHICKAGDCLAMPSGGELSFTNVPDSEQGFFAAIVICADHQLLQRFNQRYLALLPRNASNPVFSPDETCRKALSDYIEQVMLPCVSQIDSALIEVRWEALWLALARQGVASSILLAKSTTWRDRVVHLVAADPAQNWRLDVIAEHLHVSEATLRRKLAAESTSFSDIVAMVRMERALGLVMQNQLAIQRIAESCGYQSPSRFTDAFRSRFGLTPSALRASF